MIKFKHYVYHQEQNIFLLIGELDYTNYPVNLTLLDKEYFIDRFIQSFQPFLQLQKPIDKDPNIKKFTLNFQEDLYFHLEFIILRPNSLKKTFLNMSYHPHTKRVFISYSQDKIFREASRKRYREEEKDEEFLQNVLNAMARLLNTIIKDYTMMSSLVLRNGTGKFLGRAETRVAEFIGADPNIVKDGQNQLQEPLEGGRSKKIKKYEKKSKSKKAQKTKVKKNDQV
jgi:hypothetical protein